jgi:hypothetical protein
MNVTIAIVLTVALFIGVFLFWRSRPIHRDASDLESDLRSWVDGTISSESFDYLVSCKINNVDLDEIRAECERIWSRESGCIDESKSLLTLNSEGKIRVCGLIDRLVKMQQSG